MDLHLHIVPINLVVFKGSCLKQWDILSFMGRLHARCFQRLSIRHIVAQLCPAEQLVRQSTSRSVLVLETAPIKYPAPTTDRRRTVSRRSEPSSRTALMANSKPAKDRIQPQDAMSRSRCQTSPSMWTLGERSTCYPQGNFLSAERWHFHSHTTGCANSTFVTARPVSLAGVRLLLRLHSLLDFRSS